LRGNEFEKVILRTVHISTHVHTQLQVIGITYQLQHRGLDPQDTHLPVQIHHYSHIPVSPIKGPNPAPVKSAQGRHFGFSSMGGAKRFVDRFFHSGRKPGGDNGQQPDNQQSQFQKRDSGKGSLRSLSTSSKTPRSDPEATSTSHGRLRSQSDTIISGTASDRINIGASSNSLIPPGQATVLSSGEWQHPPAIPTHPSPETTGLGSDDTSAHVHCSRLPQETASGGEPGVSATAIPISNPPDIVITAIASVNPSSQTPGPVSTTSSEPQMLSTVSQPNNTVPPSVSSHIWQKTFEIAQKSLAKYQLPSVELGSLQSQSAAENIQALVAELETAYQGKKDRQWRYKDRDGNEVVWVERVGKILKSVDKYAKIVDTAIQHHPDITSLVWAGARTMLQVRLCLSGGVNSLIWIWQVALNHVEAMECFEGTMVTIMDKMAVSTFYAGIYTGVGLHTALGDTSNLNQVLDMALPELYAAVIVFAIKARQYFDARCKLTLHVIIEQTMLKKNHLGVKKAVNILKPFAIEFQPFIDDITGKEKAVQECADMATMERIRGLFISIWYY